MDLKEIQELIKLLNKFNISEIRLEQDNFKLTLRTHDPHSLLPYIKPEGNTLSQPAAVTQQPAPAFPAFQPEKEAGTKADISNTESRLITIKSPMIGTFYRSTTPEKPSFVNIGDEIKQGTVLCIIEAMKLFNEIESEHSGRIVKILVENAKPVEYDQPLFLIEPI
ncbi:MAG: acetyl-CoA carboxylase biotin carboxyl carrier protein [Chitinophagales bacterium]|nr:acetyl-CoA carboxylase biotin carboxyl carrier protein [Chitinophagales bacterium]